MGMDRYQWPSENMARIPFGVFTDEDVYREEQERLFRGNTWSYLCLEAEIPNPGDFKTVFVGDTPIVVDRAQDGSLHAFVNRCAHRGATVRRESCGNAKEHVCCYHQWCYDLTGKLIGVPFKRGVKGRGGFPQASMKEEIRLTQLRVESYRGAVFGTFSAETMPLTDYLDPQFTAHLDRLLTRPIEVLGYQRQRIRGNWKLYCENVRDPYHGGLLHLFQVTFGIYRNTQEGGTRISATKGNNISYSIQGTDQEDAKTAHADVGTYREGFKLLCPEVLAYKDDYGDRCGLSIMSVFPNAVFHQIGNSLATRQIRPKGPHEFELYWTYYGYADDTPEMREHRLDQANLAGPAGLVSMEDGEAIELVHHSIRADPNAHSFVAMGSDEPVETSTILVSEIPIRGFWHQYAATMGVGTGTPVTTGAAA